MHGYQRVIFLPGPLFGLILVVGLAGILIPRRRSAAAALLWFSAVVSIVLPMAEHEYTYRYVIPAIPLACMALALAFRDRAPAAAGGALPDSAAPGGTGHAPVGTDADATAPADATATADGAAERPSAAADGPDLTPESSGSADQP